MKKKILDSIEDIYSDLDKIDAILRMLESSYPGSNDKETGISIAMDYSERAMTGCKKVLEPIS